MLKRSTLASLALVAVGAVLGWAAASGQLSLSLSAVASVESTPQPNLASTTPTQPCCATGANPADLAKLTAHI